jgi:hypothetical protein
MHRAELVRAAAGPLLALLVAAAIRLPPVAAAARGGAATVTVEPAVVALPPDRVPIDRWPEFQAAKDVGRVTLTVTWRAGAEGFPKGGRLRFGFGYPVHDDGSALVAANGGYLPGPCYWLKQFPLGTFQTDDPRQPDYVSVRGSKEGAVGRARVVKSNTQVENLLEIQVGVALVEGDTITAVFGDASGGGPGGAMSFHPGRPTALVLADREASGAFVPAAPLPGAAFAFGAGFAFVGFLRRLLSAPRSVWIGVAVASALTCIVDLAVFAMGPAISGSVPSVVRLTEETFLERLVFNWPLLVTISAGTLGAWIGSKRVDPSRRLAVRALRKAEEMSADPHPAEQPVEQVFEWEPFAVVAGSPEGAMASVRDAKFGSAAPPAELFYTNWAAFFFPWVWTFVYGVWSWWLAFTLWALAAFFGSFFELLVFEGSRPFQGAPYAAAVALIGAALALAFARRANIIVWELEEMSRSRRFSFAHPPKSVRAFERRQHFWAGVGAAFVVLRLLVPLVRFSGFVQLEAVVTGATRLLATMLVVAIGIAMDSHAKALAAQSAATSGERAVTENPPASDSSQAKDAPETKAETGSV